ncbi:ThuA domain-containing protein [Aliifodinibius sp. S!AR15-10]|uniref:PVC-type heme-binding CxxCH protein n=1 Tax=Aliifodinibius sp. S!AR15-10 TaxID=2950437 RepID=UPI0028661DFC|nr:PVC-type heme-binding CxxCH protein [Aliifodinibius sp. S!AR15-10]MDR8390197.1 ThuA domain-containing protein [Aliifodinibius sp. S!AR15-10]
MLKHKIGSGLSMLVALLLVLSACGPTEENTSERDPHLKVLFLGDDGHHNPVERLRDIARPMLDRGIDIFYSGDINELELENLKKYDAVLLYANYHPPSYQELPKDKEQALVNYVEQGGGFIPIHSASGNFRNSEAFINLVGAAFESHGTGTFTTRIAEPDHPVMQGFEGFESWDETYVHQKHNPENRTVLSYRDDEPWTWVRTQGEGRVFYTAWGHDNRTWRNEGFHDLLERGIRWAAGQDVQQALASRKIQNPFEYVVLDVPFPPPHEERVRYEEEVGPMDRGSNYPMYYKQQKAVHPDTVIKRMITPPGFHVELFASEPEIVNPIAMNWDEQGRLWLIESIEYPYPRDFWPDGGGKDRIMILEDTDDDGKADKFTEFADSMNIPTSLTFANGGVIVQQAPQTLFLKDTDGDDKADVRKVLFEGWSQYDTHAGPNNLSYGLDNWIWGTLGYSGFEGTVGGEKHEFRMGTYRFKKDGSELDFVHRTNNNTWGFGFTESGEAFTSTANGNPSTYSPFSQVHYDKLSGLDDPLTERLTNTARIVTLTNLFRQVDWVGAYTAGAGHEFYTARNYPQKYWNKRAFVTEATMQAVGEFIFEENGSSYTASNPRNLVASDDEWFSPVAAEVGPDGNVWIADWYNYINQHNAESDRQEPTPGNAYANPLRDRTHGRIYRVVYKEGAPDGNLNLANASPEKLVQTLSHDNMLWRKHAQRLLVDGDHSSAIPQLIELVNDESVDGIGMSPGAIHAMWTLHGLGALDGSNQDALSAIENALAHPSAGVRKNAVKVLPTNGSSLQVILDSGVLDDEDLKVRRDALIALSEMPESELVGEAIYDLLSSEDNITDRWVREAGALAASVHSDGFLNSANEAGTLSEAMSDNAEVDPASTLNNIIKLVAEDNPGFQASASSGQSEELPEEDVDAVLELGVTPNVLKFDKEELRAKAGQTIRVTFNNTGNMEHNLLFITPGSLQEIGTMADKMTTSSQGRDQNYVPDSPDVVASTAIIQPGESAELVFEVPSEPGEYRFVCTIPGHWRSMQGTLIVEP